MPNVIPDNCIQCEQVLGGRLRDPVFIAAIKERQEHTKLPFKECLTEYMWAFHHWEHKVAE